MMSIRWLAHFFLQSFSEIVETTTKNGVVPVAKSNVKLLKDHVVSFKIISLYIYKDFKT